MKQFSITLTLLFCACISANAFDAAVVKSADEKCSKWLIDQFVAKDKTFGTVKAPEQIAMVLKGLCDSPADYKEASGPFIAEPVNNILSKIDANGAASDIVASEGEALGWVVTGLKAVGGDKHQEVIDRVRARMKAAGHPDWPKFEASHLTPTSATPESMRNALAAVLKAGEEGRKEIEVDGKPVKWAEVLGESLVKLQQSNGSFGTDIPTSAMALCVLNWCCKSLK